MPGVDFWNERYGKGQYVYGKKPNTFFKEQLHKLLPGKLLLPAEGEGRNAIYAASMGWEVYAFDTSEKAIEKALKLAQENGVDFQYVLADFDSYIPEVQEYDLIAWIYAHMHKNIRREVHAKFSGFLRKGGKVILEAFNKEQIDYNSGGPKTLDMLYDSKELSMDFMNYAELTVVDAHINLEEGKGHSGLASVVRLTGYK